ncbi:MAG: murein transglycosylase A [Elainella sp. C42_A2020_010]|nr:murein transglycosylase A [Elainella sp. C42_A2020_010]
MKPFVWLAISLGTMLSPMSAQGPIQISQGVTSPDSAPPIQTNQEQARLPLQRVEWSAEVSSELGLDDRLWSRSSDRAALVTAINYSLDYLQTPEAVAAYQAYPISDFSLERVRRSLVRFRQLVLTARSPEALRSAVQQEFDLYQSVGSDGEGTVSFTGYFEPVHAASRVRTGDFRYPLYRLPPDLKQWPTPHPTRLELEGADGLQNQRLRGLELVWLQDRLEAYLVQVQGSARLQLTDGSVMSIGYAGRTDYPYVSIGRELVNAGKIAASDLTLAAVRTYFRQHPAELDRYLPRNNRFVFFKETTGSPATGSLRVPVTAGRSIATDKSLMPPGALALIYTQLPESQAEDAPLPVSRYVLDQDTGGAIRGAGRVDLFVGTGTAAGEQAGQINHTGQLYYLLLKSPSS